MAELTGKVELFNGKPDIVTNDLWQLKTAYDEEVLASRYHQLRRKR